FARNLFNTPEVLPELRERLAERFVRGGADAVLLHREGSVHQRAAPSKAVNRFLGLLDVWVYKFLNLAVELLHGLVGGFVKGGADARVVLFDEGLGFAAQFIAVKGNVFLELRVEIRKSLLRSLEFGGTLFETLMSLASAREYGFQFLRVLLEPIAHRREFLFPFRPDSLCSLAQNGGMPRCFVLQLSEQRMQLCVHGFRRGLQRTRRGFRSSGDLHFGVFRLRF